MSSFTVPSLVHTAAGIDADDARRVVADRGILRISQFPVDRDAYTEFLDLLGEPIPRHVTGLGSSNADAAIWSVTCDVSGLDGPHGGDAGQVVLQSGTPHTSSPMSSAPPRYFCMLMVEAGWHGRPPGMNGESLFVRWCDVLAVIESEHAGTEIVADLRRGTPFPDGVSRPVVYRIPDSDGPGSDGVRLGADFADYLRSCRPRPRGLPAIERLTKVAARLAMRLPLATGDLVVLDNERWGHAREAVVACERRADGSIQVNPREVWNAVVG